MDEVTEIEKAILRVPVSSLAPEVEKYMNDSIVHGLCCRVVVHSVRIERKNGVDSLLISLSRVRRPT